MSTTCRRGRDVIFYFLATMACSGGAGQKTAPPPGPEPTSTPAATAPAAASNVPVDALTRPKFADADYLAAIAALEGANPAADALADIAAGRRQLLALPGSQGAPDLPGVNIPRRQLAEGVRLVRITGFVDGSENRVIVRFQMLASRYATAYNTAMLPAAR